MRRRMIHVENAASTLRVPADAMQIEPMTVAPLVAVPILILLLLGLLVKTRRRRHSRKGRK